MNTMTNTRFLGCTKIESYDPVFCIVINGKNSSTLYTDLNLDPTMPGIELAQAGTPLKDVVKYVYVHQIIIYQIYKYCHT